MKKDHEVRQRNRAIATRGQISAISRSRASSRRDRGRLPVSGRVTGSRGCGLGQGGGRGSGTGSCMSATDPLLLPGLQVNLLGTSGGVDMAGAPSQTAGPSSSNDHTATLRGEHCPQAAASTVSLAGPMPFNTPMPPNAPHLELAGGSMNVEAGFYMLEDSDTMDFEVSPAAHVNLSKPAAQPGITVQLPPKETGPSGLNTEISDSHRLPSLSSHQSQPHIVDALPCTDGRGSMMSGSANTVHAPMVHPTTYSVPVSPPQVAPIPNPTSPL